MPVETISQSQFNEIMKGERKASSPRARRQAGAQTARGDRADAAGRARQGEPPVLKHADDPGQDDTPTPPVKPVVDTRRGAHAAPEGSRRAAAPTPPAAGGRRAPPPRRPTTPRSTGPSRASIPRRPPRRRRRRRGQRSWKNRRKAQGTERRTSRRRIRSPNSSRRSKAEDEQKPPTKPKSGEAAADQPRQPFDPNAIAKLIGQAKPSATRQMASATPLGSQTQNAPHMSPSLSAALDGWLAGRLSQLLDAAPTMPQGEKYVALVRVSFNPDGSLAVQPQLVNPPSDPAWRPYAESAMRAVLKCNRCMCRLNMSPISSNGRSRPCISTRRTPKVSVTFARHADPSQLTPIERRQERC